MHKICKALGIVVGAYLAAVGLIAGPVAHALPDSSADAAAQLTALYAGPGVMFRSPETASATRVTRGPIPPP